MLDGADPFETAGLRGRVLDAWAASPARFREDANAEEDYALGGYRDRAGEADQASSTRPRSPAVSNGSAPPSTARP